MTTCMFVYEYVHVYVCIYIYVNICICVCACAYVYVFSNPTINVFYMCFCRFVFFNFVLCSNIYLAHSNIYKINNLPGYELPQSYMYTIV